MPAQEGISRPQRFRREERASLSIASPLPSLARPTTHSRRPPRPEHHAVPAVKGADAGGRRRSSLGSVASALGLYRTPIVGDAATVPSSPRGYLSLFLRR